MAEATQKTLQQTAARTRLGDRVRFLRLLLAVTDAVDKWRGVKLGQGEVTMGDMQQRMAVWM